MKNTLLSIIALIVSAFFIIYFGKREIKTNLFLPEIIDYTHKNGINPLFEAADAAKYAQDYQKANEAFRSLLTKPLSVADSQYVLNQLAFINLAMNEDTVADHWIQLLEKVTPPLSNEALADYHYNLGTWEYRTFKPKIAEQHLKAALEAYRRIYGERHLKTALCMTELGLVHYEYSRADSTLKIISEANKVFQSKEYLKAFSPINELAMSCLNIVNRSHIEGESRCDNALEMLNKLPFKNTVLMARFYCMKGYMLKKQGQTEKDSLKSIKYFKDAEVNFNKAIDLGKKKNTIRLQEFYRESIINYTWLKDSISFFQNIEKLKQLLLTQPDRYGQPDRLIGYYFYDKDPLKCKDAYLNAWKKLENDSLRDTKILMETYTSLTKSYSKLEQFDSALFFLKKNYVVGTTFEKTNLQTKDLFKPFFYEKIVFPASSFRWIGEILLKKYQKTKDIEALELAFNALSLADDLLFPGIMTADEDAISTYQKEVAEDTYSMALETTYEMYHKTKKPIFLDYMFKFCERSKAFLLYRNASGGDTVAFQKRPPSSILDSIRILGSEINQLSRQKDLGASNAQSLTTAKQKFNSLFEEVKNNYPDYYRLKITPLMPSIKSVQSKLDEGQGLIQFHWSDGKIHILFMSKGSVVCHQVSADTSFSQNMKKYIAILKQEKSVTPMEYSKVTWVIYKKLLDTLTPQLKKIKELVVIPDKELHFIPFESLVTSAEISDAQNDFQRLPYLIHRLQITYSPAWKIYQNNRHQTLPDNPSVLSMTYGSQPKVKGNLPNAQKEIDSLILIMKNPQNRELHGTECSKQNLIKWSPSFDILHLSLHAESSLIDKFDNKIYFKIPLSDTLYGFDISKMNFKAKLVVLSACSTATGKIESSEGAYSLTRSFLQVGVSNVIASLWDISESQTATILPYFYHQLAEKHTPSVSLHQAKLKYLSAKADNITAHPMYWAGLVCVD